MASLPFSSPYLLCSAPSFCGLYSSPSFPILIPHPSSFFLSSSSLRPHIFSSIPASACVTPKGRFRQIAWSIRAVRFQAALSPKLESGSLSRVRRNGAAKAAAMRIQGLALDVRVQAGRLLPPMCLSSLLFNEEPLDFSSRAFSCPLQFGWLECGGWR